MMSLQSRAVALTLALTFGCSFAFFWWQQHPASLTGPVPPPPASPADRPLPPPVRSSPAPAAAHVEAVHPPKAAAPALPPPNYDGPPLPVLFNVASHVVPAGQPGPDGEPLEAPSSVNEATVFNSSDRPLAVTVVDVSVSNHKPTQAAVFLIPGGRETFRTDSGLRLESGDQITLRSPGFHDLTQTVP